MIRSFALIALLCVVTSVAEAADCNAMRAACDDARLKYHTCPLSPRLGACFGEARAEARVCAHAALVCQQEKDARNSVDQKK